MIVRACIVAAAGLVVSAPPALADHKSLIAGLHAGDEMRYTYSHTRDETVAVLGRTGVGERTLTTETVGVRVHCKADTTVLDIVEVTFDSMRVTMQPPGAARSGGAAGGAGDAPIEVDVGGPAPAADAPAVVKDVYERLHPFVGTVLTLNIAPGSGEITSYRGGEHLKGTAAWPVVRRYVDQELFSATFGPVFQLKSNSWMPDPGQPWYVQGGVSASPMNAKSKVWETRVVEGVLADVATITGNVHATGNPDDTAKAPVFFRTINADATYTWDLIKNRLTLETRKESISTRFTRNNVMMDSDLIATSRLEMLEPRKTAPPAAPPANPPAPSTAKPAAPAPPSETPQ